MRLALVLLAISLGLPAAPPGRIVSTAPSFTETLFALGAGDRVVAVSTYCHYPAAVEKLPRIGTYLQPNVEAIARLKPDLVLVHAELRQAAAQLNGLGIRTVSLRNATLEETLGTAREIGAAIGLAERGRQLEAKLRARLRAVAAKSAGRPRRSLLFIVGRTPGRLEGMNAVGGGAYLNDLIELAGGRNVLAGSRVAYPQISMEAVMRMAPDVIVDMGDMAATLDVSAEHKRAVERLWQAQPGVKGRVFAVAADIFVVPGPRVVEAAEAFAEMLR